jgi:hypothetical protein
VLFMCFVDFVKAFDMVQRELLWSRLSQLGIQGKFLDALRYMYKQVSMRVKLSGKVADAFESILGVKQGDPLSPVLFGVFIEILPEFMEALNKVRLETLQLDFLDDCPHIDGVILFYLLFADDLTLISTSCEKLQTMLHVLQQFCESIGMDVNTTKTEILVMGRSASVAQCMGLQFYYKSVRINVVSLAKYLGVHFQSHGRFTFAVSQLCDSATRARFALQRRIREMKSLTPDMQLRLFNAIVRPILSYGCQVWGVDYLTLPAPTANGTSYYHLVPESPLEHVQLDFLRFVGGVNRTAPNWVLLQEFNVQPIQAHLVVCVVRMWNGFRGRSHVLAAHVAKADLRLMLQGVDQCWSYKLCKFLATLGKHTGTSLLEAQHAAPFLSNTPFHESAFDYFWNLRLDSDRVCSMIHTFWRNRICNSLLGNPRTTVTYPKFHAYVDWVGLRKVDERPPHLSRVMNHAHQTCLLRFRLGCWYILEVNKDRKKKQGQRRPRAQRLCTKCNRRCVEDELHVLMECPYYHAIRVQYPDLFPSRTRRTETGARMQSVLNHNDQVRLAACIYQIWIKRTEP